MTTRATQEAVNLLGDVLSELEKPKGSVAAAVRMLRRASSIVAENDVLIWCDVQMGEAKYTTPLRKLVEALDAKQKAPSDKTEKAFNQAYASVEATGIKLGRHIANEEISLKYTDSGGGFASIGFIEETHADIVRKKKGNDGTYYQHNLNNTLNFIKSAAHAHATRMYNRIAYADTPQTAFDVLKRAVDDRLLDVMPEQAEQLMLAFRAVAGDDAEGWSQALASCRRFLEALADFVSPPTSEPTAGRQLGKQQYINRLWAFMDRAIESDTNRELAKKHVDLIGAYVERAYRLTNKGVHTGVTKLEAVKAVFHTYLVTVDILDYLSKRGSLASLRLNIYTATIDELESVVGSRAIAKEIVRLRVASKAITKADLAKLKGVGGKTLQTLLAAVSLEPRV
jgi:DNA uptake protein ComE-like DNA-binding protein